MPNGPFLTVRLLPEKATRAPLLLALRPPPSTKIPASINAWLNLPISATISALGSLPASLSFVALTITMTRMKFPPAAAVGDRQPVMPAHAGIQGRARSG